MRPAARIPCTCTNHHLVSGIGRATEHTIPGHVTCNVNPLQIQSWDFSHFSLATLIILFGSHAQVIHQRYLGYVISQIVQSCVTRPKVVCCLVCHSIATSARPLPIRQDLELCSWRGAHVRLVGSVDVPPFPFMWHWCIWVAHIVRPERCELANLQKMVTSGRVLFGVKDGVG